MLDQSKTYSFPMSFNGALFRELFQKVFNEETAHLSQGTQADINLKKELDAIMSDILISGSSISKGGLNSHSSYYIMQGILEKALSKARCQGLTDCVTGHIFDSVPPLSFMMSAGSTLEKVSANSNNFGKRYRIGSLDIFLKSGNVLKLMHCSDAEKFISKSSEDYSWLTYQGILERYSRSIETKLITTTAAQFEYQASCSLYQINSMNIVCGVEFKKGIDVFSSYHPYISLLDERNHKVVEINQLFI